MASKEAMAVLVTVFVHLLLKSAAVRSFAEVDVEQRGFLAADYTKFSDAQQHFNNLLNSFPPATDESLESPRRGFDDDIAASDSNFPKPDLDFLESGPVFVIPDPKFPESEPHPPESDPNFGKSDPNFGKSDPNLRESDPNFSKPDSIFPDSNPNLPFSEGTRALLEPLEGAYVGVTYNNSLPLAEYSNFIHFKPTVVGTFCHFPMAKEDKKSLRTILSQVAKVGGMIVLTLEPYLGLRFVTERACRDLVEYIAPYELMGVSFFLRFGHEMNGAWYPWCQKPTLYKAKFRLLAGYVRSFTCRSAMLWAPNNGGSYPFSGIYACTKMFCSDFDILDTNNDGRLSMEDDMYTPYYPGDDVVDWVGMTMYHWGRKYPYGINISPEPNAFWDRLTGNYNGENGDETAVPDFYALFCNDSVHQKPLALPEVAAMYNPYNDCCETELAVKSGWWTQVLNVGYDLPGARDVSKWLPRLKMVSWFDERKREGKLTVDWTFSNDQLVRQSFRQEMLKQVLGNGHHYWKVLSGYHSDQGLVDANLAPKNVTIITNETITVTVGVPYHDHRTEIGVEIYSVDEEGIPDKLFGSGSTIVSGEQFWLVNVTVTFSEPQDPSFQEGTLYYSAYARSLQENPFNRSDTCTIRSPFVSVKAARTGQRPPAPFHPSALRISEGEIVLSFVFIFLLVSILFVACRREILARTGISATVKGAFRFAAAEGNIAVMDEISKLKDFDVNMDLVGFTALHSAVVQGQVEAVEWLLSKGANVHFRKREGWDDTALHYAAANGFADVARLLLKAGADPCAKNFQDVTPGELAFQNGHLVLSSLLFEASDICSGFGKDNGKGTHQLCLVMPSEHSDISAHPSKDSTANNSLTPVSVLDVNGLKEEERIVGVLNVGNHETERFNEREGCNESAGVNEREGFKESVDVNGSASPVVINNKSVGVDGSVSVNERSLTIPLLPKTTKKNDEDVKEYIGRMHYGLGTHGASLKKGTFTWRWLAIITQAMGILYFLWRAKYSINRENLNYSLLFLLTEIATFLPSFIFCMEIWTPVERESRSLQRMALPPDEIPSVDVYVVCYNEPVSIVEATVCAALNIMYAAEKLRVWVLDDGKKKQVEDMCGRLKQEMISKHSGPYGLGWADLQYSARTKVKGVPHHAKAGNINSQLLKGKREGEREGDFVVVFDCDMIPRPDFLDRVMPHFFDPCEGGWKLRKKLAFIQTPQDFYNVGRDDPMGHRAAFFYGPMMQGRDGLGACPCVGTGVVFRRKALVSIGGQAFGSITEDYNTAMAFMGAGFSSIYLNERLIYGLAPDDLESILKQRLRWAMGSLQILYRNNPLFKPELTVPQSLLFFQSAFQYCLSLPTLLVMLAPIIYIFFQSSPILAHVNQFCFFFSLYYTCNRLMVWKAHKDVPNKGLEMWRGTQAWVWTVPNNLKACWKVLTSELWLFKILGAREIGFSVTKKDAKTNFGQSLRATWMYLLYYISMVLGIVLNSFRIAFKYDSFDFLVGQGVAFAWGFLICMYLWPPVAMIFPWYKPSVGGKVEWDETPVELADSFHRDHGPAAEVEKQKQIQMQIQEEAVLQKPTSWKRLQSFFAIISKWIGCQQDGSITPSLHTLSGNATLLSRPQFTLMRRVRDSITYALVNSLTLSSLLLVGLLYTLYCTPSIQGLIQMHVLPLTL